MKPLVHRTPGSKIAHLEKWKPILDAHDYEVVYEPFACGLTVANYLNQKENSTLEKIICSEIDPSLQGLYSAWLDDEPREEFLEQFYAWQRSPLSEVYPLLKSIYEKAWTDPDPQYIEAAAAGMLLRLLVFNGKLAPTSTHNKLNISISKSEVQKWGKFTYEFPKRPKSIDIHGDQFGILWVPHDVPTLAVIDPPYKGEIGNIKYRDERFIRPVYFKHEPHKRDTFSLAYFPVEEALCNNITVVIACNYYTEDLQSDYESVAYNYNYELFSFDGIDPKLNNGQPSNKQPYYKDTYWVFVRQNDPLFLTLDSLYTY